VKPAPEEPEPAETPKPQDWVLPGPDTQEADLIQPTIQEPAPLEGPGGLGIGDGTGEVDWIYLTDLPSMMNRDDLIRNMRRFYPESERRAGREGTVVLDVHIGRDGQVSAVDVVESAGPAFDEAAKKVIFAARFSPARIGLNNVAVKIRQAIAFQLSN